MKLTTKMLKKIIQEELAAVMREEMPAMDPKAEQAYDQGWADAMDDAGNNSEAFGDYADEYDRGYDAAMANVDDFHSHGDLGGYSV